MSKLDIFHVLFGHVFQGGKCRGYCRSSRNMTSFLSSSDVPMEYFLCSFWLYHLWRSKMLWPACWHLKCRELINMNETNYFFCHLLSSEILWCMAACLWILVVSIQQMMHRSDVSKWKPRTAAWLFSHSSLYSSSRTCFCTDISSSLALEQIMFRYLDRTWKWYTPCPQ